MNPQNKDQIIQIFDGFFVVSLEKALNKLSSDHRDALIVTLRHHNVNYGVIAPQYTGKATACSITSSIRLSTMCRSKLYIIDLSSGNSTSHQWIPLNKCQ